MSRTRNSKEDSDTGPNLGHLQLSKMIREGRSWSGRERNCCFLNTADGKFADISAISGFDFIDDSRALAIGDWDGDGDPDLWISNRNAPRLRFLRNDAAPPGSFLSLKLQGDGKNTSRDAVGARVEIQGTGPSGRPLLRTVTAGDGFLTQSSRWLAFAIGRSAGPVEARVSWPGGETEVFTGLEAGGRFELIQGSGRARAAVFSRTQAAKAPAPSPPPRESDRARIPLVTRLEIPGLPFKDLEGEDQELLPGRGKAVLVNLWASWCLPCLEELKSFRDHSAELKKAGVEILALSTDGLRDGSFKLPPKVKSFIDRLPPPVKTGRATESLVGFLQSLHDNMIPLNKPLPLPSSFLLDAAGRLTVIYKGPVELEQLIADAAMGNPGRQQLSRNAAMLPGSTIDHPVLLSAAVENETALRFQYALNLDKLGLTSAALKQYRVITAMKPGFTEAENNTGLLLLRTGKLAEAAASFQRAISLRADYVEPRFNLAAVLDRQGKLEGAAALYLEVLRLQPDYPRANNSLGVIRARQGRKTQAAEHFRQELTLHPGFAEAHNNLGQILLELEDNKGAEARLREAIRVDPLDPHAHMNLGIALRRLGETAGAARQYLEAIRLNPRFVEAINNLGQLRMAEGKTAEAEARFRSALQINPRFSPARANLERLQKQK